MWHPKHIKNSSKTVRLKFQTEWRTFCLPGAKTPWQQPRALWAAQKLGSENAGIASNIASNCQGDFHRNHTNRTHKSKV